MLHGLVLFATKLETADTSEVTVLNNHVPPLYSAICSPKLLDTDLVHETPSLGLGEDSRPWCGRCGASAGDSEAQDIF